MSSMLLVRYSNEHMHFDRVMASLAWKLLEICYTSTSYGQYVSHATLLV